jgi:hypothetical protein
MTLREPRRKHHLCVDIAFQQHEMERDSPSKSPIGTVVAKLSRAFDNRLVTGGAGSRHNPGRTASHK